MNWFTTGKRRVKKSSSVKRNTTKKRSSSRKKRTGSRTGSSKRTSKIVFVNGKPRTAQPKPGGSGYYYVRRASNGKVQKVSVAGKTYTKTQAKAKMRKTSRK